MLPGEDRSATTAATRNNRTLTTIATVRPSDEGSLLAINGVGPAFIEKFAPEVLALVAEHSQPLAA